MIPSFLDQVNISRPSILVHCNITEILTIHGDICTGLICLCKETLNKIEGQRDENGQKNKKKNKIKINITDPKCNEN